MDISPLLHALCAVAAQILVGLFTGNAVLGCCANWVITDPVYGSFPFCVR